MPFNFVSSFLHYMFNHLLITLVAQMRIYVWHFCWFPYSSLANLSLYFRLCTVVVVLTLFSSDSGGNGFYGDCMSDKHLSACQALDMIRGKNILLLMDSHLEGNFSTEEATVVFDLASQCLQYEPRERPKTKDLVSTLAPLQNKNDASSFISFLHKFCLYHSLNYHDRQTFCWCP